MKKDRFLLSSLAVLTACAAPSQPLASIGRQTTQILKAVGSDTYDTLEADGDSLYLANRSGYQLTQRKLNQPGTSYKFNYVPHPVIFRRPINVPMMVGSTGPSGVSVPTGEPASYPWLALAEQAQQIYLTSMEPSSVYFLAPIYKLTLNQNAPNESQYDPPQGYNPTAIELGAKAPVYPKDFTFKQNDYPSRPQGMAHRQGQGWYLASMLDHRIFHSQGNQFEAWVGNKEPGYVDGPAASARFEYPRALESDASGNVYVLEADKHRVRKISPEGRVSTLAGSTEAGFKDAKGTEARFNAPFDLAVNAQGDVFVSDTGNHRIRKITSDGTVSTMIGTGETGFSEGTLSQAKTGNPMGIDFGPDGTLYYIAEGNVFRARLD